MSRSPIPSWFIVLVVVRKGDRFLAVHEASHGERWYLPAGRVEIGEKLTDAALRETLEETGLRVALEGIVRIEHGLSPGGGARVRVIFTARPVDSTPPKSAPDAESIEARWVTLEELGQLPLRHDEVQSLFAYVARGGPIYPLDLLAEEGSKLPI